MVDNLPKDESIHLHLFKKGSFLLFLTKPFKKPKRSSLCVCAFETLFEYVFEIPNKCRLLPFHHLNFLKNYFFFFKRMMTEKNEKECKVFMIIQTFLSFYFQLEGQDRYYVKFKSNASIIHR